MAWHGRKLLRSWGSVWNNVRGSTSSNDLLFNSIASKIVDAYRCNISPCLDCRHCWKNSGCSINDEMQDVYKYIQECDNILIASPLYFSELTGKLLDVGSLLQSRYYQEK